MGRDASLDEFFDDEDATESGVPSSSDEAVDGDEAANCEGGDESASVESGDGTAGTESVDDAQGPFDPDEEAAHDDGAAAAATDVSDGEVRGPEDVDSSGSIDITSRWRPSAQPCSRCESTVHRGWISDDGFVCTECAAW